MSNLDNRDAAQKIEILIARRIPHPAPPPPREQQVGRVGVDDVVFVERDGVLVHVGFWGVGCRVSGVGWRSGVGRRDSGFCGLIFLNGMQCRVSHDT